ncbi:MAG TPA: AtpZ/AtpI family protein [Desulfomonilaceae bacterium]|nr:AtpZ/AtpI family protein [Desulfomonilaceae bacterium]
MGMNSTWKVVGDALQLGASIVLAVFIGAGIGYWLDGKLGTFPYLSIIFFFLGIAAAGRNVWLAVRKQLREDEEKRRK